MKAGADLVFLSVVLISVVVIAVIESFVNTTGLLLAFTESVSVSCTLFVNTGAFDVSVVDVNVALLSMVDWLLYLHVSTSFGT